MAAEDIRIKPTERLVSLDVFRGLTMALLVSSAFGLGHLSREPAFGFFAKQFTHHQWNGLYFWDLIQPFFMFIVGVAMPFSFAKRWERGETWSQSLVHVLKRSVTLFLLGVILHCWYSKALVWELWNVLTQLSVTYLVALLFMKKSLRAQLFISLGILLFNYLAYRFIPLPGVSDPWLKDANLGAFMDRILMGKINAGGGWVTINVIGSSAHTMWGVMAGIVLKSTDEPSKKIKTLLIAGIAFLIAGYALDPITPIVKRICTSSFILASGGYALIALTFFYWLVDVKGSKGWTKFFVIVGMNPIFVYMWANLLGGWTNQFTSIFTNPLLEPLGVWGEVIQSNIVFGVYFYLLWWLYKRKIVIRI